MAEGYQLENAYDNYDLELVFMKIKCDVDDRFSLLLPLFFVKGVVIVATEGVNIITFLKGAYYA